MFGCSCVNSSKHSGKYIQDVAGGKVNIRGGHSIGHLKKKVDLSMCPIPNCFRYLARNIFRPSRRNAPMSEACESV
jgi:hypothetical protein